MHSSDLHWEHSGQGPCGGKEEEPFPLCCRLEFWMKAGTNGLEKSLSAADRLLLLTRLGSWRFM